MNPQLKTGGGASATREGNPEAADQSSRVNFNQSSRINFFAAKNQSSRVNSFAAKNQSRRVNSFAAKHMRLSLITNPMLMLST